MANTWRSAVYLVEAESVEDYLARYYRPERMTDSLLEKYEEEYKRDGYVATSHHDNVSGRFICWPRYPDWCAPIGRCGGQGRQTTNDKGETMTNTLANHLALLLTSGCEIRVRLTEDDQRSQVRVSIGDWWSESPTNKLDVEEIADKVGWCLEAAVQQSCEAFHWDDRPEEGDGDD